MPAILLALLIPILWGMWDSIEKKNHPKKDYRKPNPNQKRWDWLDK